MHDGVVVVTGIDRLFSPLSPSMEVEGIRSSSCGANRVDRQNAGFRICRLMRITIIFASEARFCLIDIIRFVVS